MKKILYLALFCISGFSFVSCASIPNYTGKSNNELYKSGYYACISMPYTGHTGFSSAELDGQYELSQKNNIITPGNHYVIGKWYSTYAGMTGTRTVHFTAEAGNSYSLILKTEYLSGDRISITPMVIHLGAADCLECE